MTLSDLPDTTEVSIDLIRILQRLTDAKNANDTEIEGIINHAIFRLNNFSSSAGFPLEPPMSVGEVKRVFPDYEENPPPFRLFTENANQSEPS